MMRARAFAMITAFGATAAGADADEPCPDGWFCEPADEASQPAEQPVEPPTRQQEQLPSEPPRFDEPPPPSVFDVRREESDEPLLERGLGVFGRLQWALVGEGVPLMGGGGVGFRAAPLPHIALDLAIDAAYGRDDLDAKRFEAAISAAVIAFLNPGDYVQVYLSIGPFHSWADVEPRGLERRHYRYWGAFMGLGAEYPLSSVWAFGGELTGFIRGRADAGWRSEPEFIDKQTGATSNASGGALLRGQLTRYF